MRSTSKRPVTRPPTRRPDWSRTACWLVALWSAAMCWLGAHWAAGGAGYPFGPASEDRTSGSVLEGAPVEVVGPTMVVLGAVGAVVAVLMANGRATRLRTPITVYAALSAVAFAAVVPDYTVLALLAMWPALLVFAFTGIPGAQDGIGDVLYWHRDFLLIVFAGGLLWAAAATAYHRRSVGRCIGCGRDPQAREPAWKQPDAALRWGRRAVWVAVLSTVPYEATRIAWALGWPLGISHRFHQMMADTPGMLQLGGTLALLSIGGAVLTHGLVAPWGEVFPRWTGPLAGRRVPPRLAIVPAALVAVALPPAGLMNAGMRFHLTDWGATAPGILWFGWAGGLAVAAYAYYLRTRTACRRCGEGEPVPAGSTTHSRETNPLS